MRVIAGKYGSRRISSGGGMSLRPTSDRLRETLFDILQSRIEGCFFVDGYAGTGAVGIEALSRGARAVAFLEKHRASIALIQRNLEALGITQGAEILRGDVVASLGELASRGEPADILFFDPPYRETQEYDRILDALGASSLVAAHTLLIFERQKKHALPAAYDSLTRLRSVVQGDAALDFFGLKTEEEGPVATCS
jgi:16S rRNA (guanine(966)-N(2))-methyltransferase RsmD